MHLDGIKVTFELSFSAAKQLRELAVSRDDRLKDIGIVKVKINNGSEISLLDHDNFKVPTLPVFTSRKDYKGKPQAQSSNRIGRNLQKHDINRTSSSPKTTSDIIYPLGTPPLTDHSNQLCENGLTDGADVTTSGPPFLPAALEKKRVVLISQGTATDDSQQQSHFSSHNDENFPPHTIVNNSQLPVEEMSELTDYCLTSARSYNEALDTALETISSLRAKDLNRQSRDECKRKDKGLGLKDNDTDKNYCVTSESCGSVEITERMGIFDNAGTLNQCEARSCDQATRELLRNDDIETSERLKHKQLLTGDTSIEALAQDTNSETVMSISATSTQKPFFREQRKESTISTKNFQALQMLSDICVSETNMTNSGRDSDSQIDAFRTERFTKACQTEVGINGIFAQNIEVEFVDENKIALKVCDMGTAFKLATAKCKHTSRKAVTPPVLSSSEYEIPRDNVRSSVPGRRQLQKSLSQEECGCMSGNYHACIRSKRRRRHTFSSSSFHKMTLRSRDDDDLDPDSSDSEERSKFDSPDETMKVAYNDEMKDISPSEIGIGETDCNNNDTGTFPTQVSTGYKLMAQNCVRKSPVSCIQFVPDEKNLTTISGTTRHNTSPLAMLKGTVSRIPTPDVPCHQRDESTPKNIVSEYTEIIRSKLEGPELVDDDSYLAKSTVDSKIDDLDFITQPPPLLYKEHGTISTIQFQKTSFLDTPPPLNESAVTALTRLSNRKNSIPASIDSPGAANTALCCLSNQTEQLENSIDEEGCLEKLVANHVKREPSGSDNMEESTVHKTETSAEGMMPPEQTECHILSPITMDISSVPLNDSSMCEESYEGDKHINIADTTVKDTPLGYLENSQYSDSRLKSEVTGARNEVLDDCLRHEEDQCPQQEIDKCPKQKTEDKSVCSIEESVHAKDQMESNFKSITEADEAVSCGEDIHSTWNVTDLVRDLIKHVVDNVVTVSEMKPENNTNESTHESKVRVAESENAAGEFKSSKSLSMDTTESTVVSVISEKCVVPKEDTNLLCKIDTADSVEEMDVHSVEQTSELPQPQTVNVENISTDAEPLFDSDLEQKSTNSFDQTSDSKECKDDLSRGHKNDQLNLATFDDHCQEEVSTNSNDKNTELNIHGHNLVEANENVSVDRTAVNASDVEGKNTNSVDHASESYLCREDVVQDNANVATDTGIVNDGCQKENTNSVDRALEFEDFKEEVVPDAGNVSVDASNVDECDTNKEGTNVFDQATKSQVCEEDLERDVRDVSADEVTFNEGDQEERSTASSEYTKLMIQSSDEDHRDVSTDAMTAGDCHADEKSKCPNKKGKGRKRLSDGTIVDDLSYVLKRIQGDDSDGNARGRKTKPLTRRQLKLSDNPPRSLKRLRYTR